MLACSAPRATALAKVLMPFQRLELKLPPAFELLLLEDYCAIKTLIIDINDNYIFLKLFYGLNKIRVNIVCEWTVK